MHQTLIPELIHSHLYQIHQRNSVSHALYLDQTLSFYIVLFIIWFWFNAVTAWYRIFSSLAVALKIPSEIVCKLWKSINIHYSSMNMNRVYGSIRKIWNLKNQRILKWILLKFEKANPVDMYLFLYKEKDTKLKVKVSVFIFSKSEIFIN